MEGKNNNTTEAYWFILQFGGIVVKHLLKMSGFRKFRTSFLVLVIWGRMNNSEFQTQREEGNKIGCKRRHIQILYQTSKPNYL